jgi:nitroreductase
MLASMGYDLAAFTDLASARRSSLRMDRDRPIDEPTLASLIEVATWAPNHKQNWPWRFAAFTGDGRATLGDAIADLLSAAGIDDAKVAKTRTKYLRAPMVLAVASDAATDPLRHVENRDAVAAAVQTLLLAATANGMASFWSTCPPPGADAVRSLAGWAADAEVVALIYLGWPSADAADTPVPQRPRAAIRHIGG